MPVNGKLFFLLPTALLFLTACGGNAGAAATMDLDAVRTEAVATYIAHQTPGTKIAAPATFTPAPISTNTPSNETPTPTYDPKSSCYDLLWLADVTIPDYSRMKAGEVFTKTWKVQNTGGCAWAPGFTFSLIGGEAMNGRTLILTEPVPVGAKVDLSIEMVAPTGRSGVIAGTWQMADNKGNFFGDALSVYIDMGGEPTVTSSP